MNEVFELERRLSQALDRIGAGIEALPPAGDAPASVVAPDRGAEIARLEEALQAEKDANAQLTERVRVLHKKHEALLPELETRVEALTRQIDGQGVEVQRLKQVNVQLRETIGAMREAMARGVSDPALVNKSMAAELESLRVARAAEIAELDQILGELQPLIEEVSDA